MPYNGIKADAARQRLIEAMINANGQAPQTGAPVQGPMPISSGYGNRVHPILRTRKFHPGVDIPVPIGTPVYATADGYVSQAQNKSAGSVRGNNVSLKHPDGTESRYEHLDRFSDAALKGGPVRKGDLIGYSGTTGRSTGPHLHYGLYRGEQPLDPLKPMTRQRSYAGV